MLFHHHQTFDQDGNIISEIIEEYIEEVVLLTPEARAADVLTRATTILEVRGALMTYFAAKISQDSDRLKQR